MKPAFNPMLVGMAHAVAQMNVAFGNPEGSPKKIEWGRLQKQCDNIAGPPHGVIKGEVEELHRALSQRNLTDVRDALCDIMVFALGAYHFLGIDAEEDMLAVLEGVMSRFCKDIHDLEATAKKYQDLKVEFYNQGFFPTMCLKSAKDQHDINGEHYPQGKFLKSASFKQPVFKKVSK